MSKQVVFGIHRYYIFGTPGESGLYAKFLPSQWAHWEKRIGDGVCLEKPIVRKVEEEGEKVIYLQMTDLPLDLLKVHVVQLTHGPGLCFDRTNGEYFGRRFKKGVKGEILKYSIKHRACPHTTTSPMYLKSNYV